MHFKTLCLLLGIGTLLWAQSARQDSKAAAARLGADLIRTGLYVIYGPAGNTLLRLTANGLLMVGWPTEKQLPGADSQGAKNIESAGARAHSDTRSRAVPTVLPSIRGTRHSDHCTNESCETHHAA